ncbi:MAG: Vitamin B12 dependent methionine synthase activation subunit [bacterium]|nr:Vitamin B12 dependent methionine synthase activation subunit [bacterium]
MDNNIIYTSKYSFNEINIYLPDILRYMGYADSVPDGTVLHLIEDFLKSAEQVITYKICYLKQNICIKKDVVDFGFMKPKSSTLAGHLSGCSQAVIFAATIGTMFDREFISASQISALNSLVIDSIGTAAVEALCDKFCNDLSADGMIKSKMRFRYSAGYGDFSIEHQSDILRSLDSFRKIGLTTTQNLMLTPTKSVTAVIGVD